jgi:hypothetical protein
MTPLSQSKYKRAWAKLCPRVITIESKQQLPLAGLDLSGMDVGRVPVVAIARSRADSSSLLAPADRAAR